MSVKVGDEIYELSREDMLMSELVVISKPFIVEFIISFDSVIEVDDDIFTNSSLNINITSVIILK